MTVGRICSRVTHLAERDESAQVAAERMKSENVGTLVVIDEDLRPVGILTDRDLAVRVVAPGMDCTEARVGDVMTTHPRWVREDTPIEEALAAMRGLAVRRLPVVDAGRRLVGIVSIDDVLELVTEELGNLSKIVGWSQPGIGLPVSGTERRSKAPTSGLQRATSDLEC